MAPKYTYITKLPLNHSWTKASYLLLVLVFQTLTLLMFMDQAHTHPPNLQGIQSFNPEAPDRLDISVLARSSELYLVGFYINLSKLYETIHTPEDQEKVDWRPARPFFERFTRSIAKIYADNELIEAEVKFPNLEQTGQFNKTQGDFVELHFHIPTDAKNLTLKVNELVKNPTVGIMDLYRPKKIELSEGDDHLIILRGGTLTDVQISSMQQVKNTGPVTKLQTFILYLKEGFLHILPAGLDHILFVLALFLLTTRWQSLLIQVSTFTIAHTITLAFSTLATFNLPAYIVEPLIALSITYVAFENLITHELKKSRLLLVFLFGLLHGLGFASVLSDLGLSAVHFTLSLLSFNIGVELGQLTILAVAFLLVYPFRQKSIYHSYIVRPGSVLIGIIGLWWGVERILT